MNSFPTSDSVLAPDALTAGRDDMRPAQLPQPFASILYRTTDDRPSVELREPPPFFSDLNLDQIVDGITAGKQEYDLKPFFYASLREPDAILYRHEVMRDLTDKAIFAAVTGFAKRMRAMRDRLAKADKLYYRLQKECLFMEAVQVYCRAIGCLVRELGAAKLKSRGLSSLRKYLADYKSSDRFTSLLTETNGLKIDLSSIQYCMLMRDNSINIRRYESEVDYSAEVLDSFAKFKQGAVKDYRVEFADSLDMNHVEAAVLDLVAKLYPQIFAHLGDYCVRNVRYLDEIIGRFDREIQFYISYQEYIGPLERAGLAFCYPAVAADRKEVNSQKGFDVALAQKLVRENAPVICNDFHLEGRERIFVVSGPNQGGKTTFARSFGQFHHLASIGCPVPGGEARLFLFDRLFTHFEREEDIKTLRGKLEDDLVRIQAILNQATSRSVVIMNEIFTSTTLADAIFLGKRVMEKIMALDLLCVCVTFIDELASLSEKTVSMVSMVSTVIPENPAERTFKVVRRPADGLSYAISIAEKYRLTYDSLRERIKP